VDIGQGMVLKIRAWAGARSSSPQTIITQNLLRGRILANTVKKRGDKLF